MYLKWQILKKKTKYVRRLEHYFNVGATNRIVDMVTDEKIYTLTTKRSKKSC